jgi:hypothetical protein
MAVTSNRASLDALEPLVGEWSLLAVFEDVPPADIGAPFGGDGKTITGAWEIRHDGTRWEHDFDLTYVKT